MPSSRWSLALAVTAALVLAASCTDATSCAGDADCGPEAVCYRQVCVARAAFDAGGMDAGPPDSGVEDAGPGDAGEGDGGPPDAGPPDAGPPDAGPPDGGEGDGGPPDGDAGVPDCAGVAATCTQAYEECLPTLDGGLCVSAGLSLEVALPAADVTVGPDASVPLRVVVRRAGTEVAAAVPFVFDGQAQLLDAGATVELRPGGLDGVKALVVGWDAGRAPPQVTRLVTVDATPPTLVFRALPTPPARPAHWLDGGFRRDEVVPVVVEASDEDALGVALHLSGDGGALLPEAAGDFCGVTAGPRLFCFRVDLALPPLDGLSGAVSLVASGRDALGNARVGVDGGALPVTRLRWQVQPAPAVDTAPPAVGTGGVVYLGLSDGGGGGALFAYGPDGLPRWDAGVEVGAVASLAVGTSGGAESVFFAATDSAGGLLSSVAASTGAPSGVSCRGDAGSGAAMAVALRSTDAGLVQAVGVLGGSAGEAVACAVTAGDVAEVVLGDGAANDPGPWPGGGLATPSNVVLAGARALWGALGAALRFTGLQDDAPSSTPGTLATLSTLPEGLLSALGLGAGRLAASARSPDQLALVDLADGGVVSAAVPGAGPAVQPSDGVYWVASSAGLRRLALDAGALVETRLVATTSPLSGASPVLGDDGRVYAVDEAGRLYSDAVAFGRLPLASGAQVHASPALDCSRDGGVGLSGRPGVLYVATRTGVLTAVLVDATGLERGAPWPMWQRDVAHTGNPAFFSDGGAAALNPGCP